MKSMLNGVGSLIYGFEHQKVSESSQNSSSKDMIKVIDFGLSQPYGAGPMLQ